MQYRSVRTAAFVALCTAAAACCGDASGQTARVSITPRAAKPAVRRANAIRFDLNLVLVPVTVTDPMGVPVAGLPRSAFRLFEDGVEQQVKYFASDDAPISAGVVFDASRSMEGKLDQSREAVAQFFRASAEGDEFFLVEFNDAPRLLSGFTPNSDGIEKILTQIRPKNWTALFDAVYLAVHQMRKARYQRKALIILSDGADNNSRYSEAEILSRVREADVCIYSIALTGGSLLKRHTHPLRRLAEETGGQMFEVGKMADLPDAISKINRAIRNQYLLGFHSSGRNGLYRKLQVRLEPPGQGPPLRASARSGYYARAGEEGDR